MKCGIAATGALSMLCLSGWADIIQSSNVVPWIPGVTVGLQAGIPLRTNLIDVSASPYNADTNGVLDTSTAIASAVSAAGSNDVIYFPDGRYILSNAILCQKNYITFRGHTNSILIGQQNNLGNALFKVGPDRQNATRYTISSGATKGSTSIVLSTPPTTFAVGDQVSISDSDFGAGSPTFPRINISYYDNNLKQQVSVIGITGNTLTLSSPLVWTFTNSPVVIDCGATGTKGVGIENLTLTGTNTVNGGIGAYGFMLQLSMCQRCWVTNCNFYYAGNYFVYVTASTHIYYAHNTCRFATSYGSNHSGLLVDTTGESLFEDSIFADGIFPGIEFNSGTCGNAFFANYFTNNSSYDIMNHGPHPMMNLFEQNNMSAGFLMDGYFGSASHETLFRNVNQYDFIPLKFNRWCSYMNVVANVLGKPGQAYTNLTHDINDVGYAIMMFGRPTIGLTHYTGTNPPIPWNYPGKMYDDVTTNGAFTFTNTQVNTTTLTGYFANIPPYPYASVIFQDAVDTNSYWLKDGILTYATAQGTATNLTLNRAITVSNGWTIFATWQNPQGYQQLQTLDRVGYTITGNYDYYTHGITWDTDGAQSVPSSMLYTNGPPPWWGTNRWPAIDPLSSPMVATIPAQLRYSGVSSGGGGGGGGSPAGIVFMINGRVITSVSEVSHP